MQVSIQSGDVTALHRAAALAEQWRPVAHHHSVKRLGEEARYMMQEMTSIVALDVKFEFVQRESPLADAVATQPSQHPSFVFLMMLRRWMTAIERADKRILPEIARYYPRTARDYIPLRDSAYNRVKTFRAVIAFLIDEDDDRALGYEFIPTPPPPAPAVSTVFEDSPDSEMEVRFSEAAAQQLAVMKARAEAEPGSAYDIIWNGVRSVLSGMHLASLESSYYEDDSGSACMMPRSRLGRARFFFISSYRTRRVRVLLICEWSRDNPYEAVARLRERFQSDEWDYVFAELNAFIRPTPRGREVMLQAIDHLLAAHDVGHRDELDALKKRLLAAEPHEPVLVEDVTEALEAVASEAEDLIDVADAEAALLSDSERLPWLQIKTELET